MTTPLIITTPHDMQTWATSTRAQGQRIAFVPTMGYLHAGHCRLMEVGRNLGDQLVLSIFVNPTQFGPTEDLSRYPRDWEGDLEKARQCKVDVIFFPSVHDMYPNPARPEPVEGQASAWFDKLTMSGAKDLCTQLCGVSRPGHFRGVATIVTKLFNIIQPHVALFGEKDYQQLQVIRQLVRDLNLPITIQAVPIVRETDGLAMSSRNSYLSATERTQALALYRSVQAAQAEVAAGRTNPQHVIETARQILNTAQIRIDYVSLCDAATLQPLSTWQSPAVLAIAAFVGQTRLIDNVIFP